MTSPIPSTYHGPFVRVRPRLSAVALAALLALTGCSTVGTSPDSSATEGSPAATTTASAPPTASRSATPSRTATPSPTAKAVQFATANGAYSFNHPAEWSVDADPTQKNVYLVRRADGEEVARLATNMPAGPLASPAYPATVHTSKEVPGLAESLGRTVTAVLGIYPGQAVGGESIMYSLADGGDPAANSGRIRAADASFLSFTGTVPIGNGSTMLTEQQLQAQLEQYASSSEGKAVLEMLSSLSTNPAVTGTACQDDNYVYTGLQGLDCAGAQSIVSDVITSGRPAGVHSIETEQHYCAGQGAAAREPGEPLYACGVLPIDTDGVRFGLNPVADEHPLLHAGTGESATAGGSAEGAAADASCTGVAFDYTELQGLSCEEAKGMLQPFTEGKATSVGEFGLHYGDTQCVGSPKERNGAMVPSWSCTRANGGSFVAYSKTPY